MAINNFVIVDICTENQIREFQVINNDFSTWCQESKLKQLMRNGTVNILNASIARNGKIMLIENDYGKHFISNDANGASQRSVLRSKTVAMRS